MRRVKYFKMGRRAAITNKPVVAVNYDSLYERVDLGEAWFHTWGMSVEYGNEHDGVSSVASYTTAIIETDEGKIIEHNPEWIEFITAPMN